MLEPVHIRMSFDADSHAIDQSSTYTPQEVYLLAKTPFDSQHTFAAPLTAPTRALCASIGETHTEQVSWDYSCH